MKLPETDNLIIEIDFKNIADKAPKIKAIIILYQYSIYDARLLLILKRDAEY